MSVAAVDVSRLDEYLELARELGGKVRSLKEGGAAKEEVLAVVKELQAAKKQVAAIQEVLHAEHKQKTELSRKVVELATRKFFYIPSFEIYSGVAGLFDYGPPGCALKDNIVREWRRHFVLRDQMLEISTSAVTPAPVLRVSGHEERFTDFLVHDKETKEAFRADKLLEGFIDRAIAPDAAQPLTSEEKEALQLVRVQADSFSQEELTDVLIKHEVTTEAGNRVSDPQPFNLMFATMIGPSGKAKAYLRPETAQGMFVNFRRLAEYNSNQMPFAAAQVGRAYRNEIAPQSGLLRCREFLMAEIEHFYDPQHPEHKRINEVRDVRMTLLPNNCQMEGEEAFEMTVGEALDKKVIQNETLAYYMARTQQFLETVGVHADKLRFRQHLQNEMAHYSSDCWDAEAFCHHDWLEIVGHANRGCYDLEAHAAATKKDLQCQEVFETPRIVQQPKFKLDNKGFNVAFGKKQKVARKYLASLKDEEAGKAFEARLAAGSNFDIECDGETVSFDPKLILGITYQEKKISTRKYLPHVVEPAFGIGRILYCVLEHAYTERVKEGEASVLLAFRPCVAPTKVGVATIQSGAVFLPYVLQVQEACTDWNLESKADTSTTADPRGQGGDHS
jgi:glycyl-tRNA synthetase